MLWLTRQKLNKNRAHRLSRAAAPCELFDPLEQRVVLWAGPMLADHPPVLATPSVLEHDLNTVVRMHTNMGNIDIELFNQAAPGTVANFLNYIRNGRLDETIFHHSDPQTLRGGAVMFHNDVGLTPVAPFAPIVGEFGRLNIAGTIGMHRPAGEPDAATSQFYINLADNTHLDDAGFTVFGRILEGSSWNLVQTIAGLQTASLNQEFLVVPAQPGFDPQNPTETTLVRINDIEVIKAAGSMRYYVHATQFPEGYRGSNVVETVHLQSMDLDVANHYQIIVRYESGIRDQVISTGVLQPGHRLTFRVSDMNDPGVDVVRPDTPYAIEIRSTRAMAATLNRQDFGVSTEESMITAQNIRRGELVRWNLVGGEKGPDIQSFVTWQNLTGEEVGLNIFIRYEDGTVVQLGRRIEPFRRGGLNIQDIPALPAGRFSVQINASNPIVAAISQYHLGPSATTTFGTMSSGVMRSGVEGGAGAPSGIIAGAILPTGGEAFVEFLYTAPTPAQITVSLDFFFTGDPIPQTWNFTLEAGQRYKRFSLEAINPGLPRDEFFTLRYRVAGDAAPVAGQYILNHAGDEMATPFQINATRAMAFAGGTGSANTTDVISIFNPYAPGVTFFVDLRFQFADGTTMWASGTGSPFGINSGERMDVVPYDIQAVRDKIDSAPEFRFYSVTVESAQFAFPVTPLGAVMAQLTQINQADGTAHTTLAARDPRLPVSWLPNL
jgi:peptidyl-prolyl cis-trans isomerase A (cyclophilin A)